MTGAPYTNPSLPPPVTGRSFKRIALTLLVLMLVVAGVLYGMLKLQGKKAAAAVGEKAVTTWKTAMVYPPAQDLPEKPPPPQDDPMADRLAALERKHEALLHALERQGQRRTTSQVAAPLPRPQVEPPSAPLFITNKLEETKTQGATTGYTLAPGATKLPCQIESQMESEIPGVFTAKISTNVYDTRTGKHLLIPQGSTLLGRYNSSELVYGNTRVPTLSLSLALPNAHTIDLGQAPVTDQQGVQGLTGDVDQRYWEFFKAIFIGGVLKGGTQAFQSAAASTSPAAALGNGLVTEGAQQGQVRTRSIDTRPRITVYAGQQCFVILTKALELPTFQY